MSRKKRAWTLLALLTCLLTAAGCRPAFGEVMPDAVWDTQQRGSVLVDYSDDPDGTRPISGAEFTLYKIADCVEQTDKNGKVRSTYKSLFKDVEIIDVVKKEAARQARMESFGQKNPYDPVEGYTGKISAGKDRIIADTDTDPFAYLGNVQEFYKKSDHAGDPFYTVSKTTDEQGKAEFSAVPLGLYILAETEPAPQHWVSAPCLIALPFMDESEKGVQYWNYDRTVEPKARPLGNIQVSKELVGNNTEKDREWHFILSLRETSDYVHGQKIQYSYQKSDGTTGAIGDGDTISLRGGQNLKVEGIPSGTEYAWTETEADTDSYQTYSTGGSGHVRAFETASASFTNIRNKGIKGSERVQTGDMDFRPYAFALAGGLICLFIVGRWKKKNKEEGGEF
ncbi:MAG: pilin N-terminal domain-containing protein [Eubacterium sp.]|nr:pilin N-terminal domain-containing protein [Eubacterium sp.]